MLIFRNKSLHIENEGGHQNISSKDKERMAQMA